MLIPLKFAYFHFLNQLYSRIFLENMPCSLLHCSCFDSFETALLVPLVAAAHDYHICIFLLVRIAYRHEGTCSLASLDDLIIVVNFSSIFIDWKYCMSMINGSATRWQRPIGRQSLFSLKHTRKKYRERKT